MPARGSVGLLPFAITARSTVRDGSLVSFGVEFCGGGPTDTISSGLQELKPKTKPLQSLQRSLYVAPLSEDIDLK